MAIRLTPEGTYGTKAPGGKLLKKFFESLSKRGIESYRRTGGTNRMTRMMPPNTVLLTTKGAKSGVERPVFVGGFAYGDDAWLVIASNSGSARHPVWLKNMAAHPDGIWLQIGSRKMKVRGESLTGQVREEAFRRISEIAAGYGRYERKTDREIPIVRLTRISD